MLSRAQLFEASVSPKHEPSVITTRALTLPSELSDEDDHANYEEDTQIIHEDAVAAEDYQEVAEAETNLLLQDAEPALSRGSTNSSEAHETSMDSAMIESQLPLVKMRLTSSAYSTTSKRDVSLSMNTPLYDTQYIWKSDSDQKPHTSDLVELGSHVKKALDRYKHFAGQPLTYNRTSITQSLSDVISNEKLRYMPTRGSKLDQAFKTAEAFAKSFSAFVAAVGNADIADSDGTAIVTSSCRTLISLIQRSTIGVERAFAGLNAGATILAAMARKVQYRSGSLRIPRILEAALAIMVDTSIDAAASMRSSTLVGGDTISNTFLETRFVTIRTRLAQLKVEFDMELLSQWLLNEGDRVDIRLILSDLEFGLDTCPPAYIHILLDVCSSLRDQKEAVDVVKWFRLVWSSFEKHRQDCRIAPQRWFEFYEEYVEVLKTVAKLSACIDLADSFRAIMLADYGATHYLFVRANLAFAALLELDDSRYQEAVLIYEAISGYDIHSFADFAIISDLIESAKHRLMILFERHEDLQHKSEALYLEAFITFKTKYGCAHEKVIGALIAVVESFRKRKGNAGIISGVKVIEGYITDLLGEVRDVNALFRVAQSMTKLYRQLSSVELGIKFLMVLKEQFYYQGSLPVEFGYLDFKPEARLDRRAIVFISVLEQMLCGYEHEGILDRTIRSIFEETCLYEAWFAAQRSELSINARMIAGARLFAHLERASRHNEMLRLRKEMWEVFRALYTSSTNSASLDELFELCIANAAKKQVSIALLSQLVKVTLETYSKGEYRASLELVRWSQTLFRQLIIIEHKRVVELAFRISSSFSKPVGDNEILMDLHRISSEILLEVLKLGRTEIDFAEISITQLNVLIRLLGQKKNYPMLEHILQYLWDSRMSQNWSGEVTVATGKRLCEVKFAASHHQAAIALLNSICYNLRDVYGPLHQLTRECENLLASFHHKCGQHGDAREVYTNVLQHIATAARERQQDPRELLELTQECAPRMKWACELGQSPAEADGKLGTVFADVQDALGEVPGIAQDELEGALDASASKKEFTWAVPDDWSLPFNISI